MSGKFMQNQEKRKVVTKGNLKYCIIKMLPFDFQSNVSYVSARQLGANLLVSS
jgi:hypothetical protein